MTGLRIPCSPASFLRVLFALSMLSLGGCAGDPDIDGAAAELVLPTTVERVRWQRAPAGCEGVATDGLSVASCEGEPLLGALIDGRGAVRCVDAVSLLRVEVRSIGPITPASGDPSPQPNLPGSLPVPLR